MLKFAFSSNQLTKITIQGNDVTIGDNLLADTKDFKEAYQIGGAGTYIGIQEGTWTKQ